MIALYLGAAALLAACFVVGHGVCALTTSSRAAPWAPAVGFAALLVLARVGTELPGRVDTAAGFVLGAVVVALAFPRTRAALRRRAADRVFFAACVLVLASLPFLVFGYAGILGVGQDNDMTAHLTAAWWLGTHGPGQPVAATHHSLIAQGYPLGPHAVAAALARLTGYSLVHTFDAVTIVPPVLAALATLGALPARVPRLVRWFAGALVGLCYMTASYLAQGAFKEVLIGALLVAFAVTLRAVAAQATAERGAAWREGIPLGVLAAGTFYTYDLFGLAWPLLATAILLALEALRRRRAALAAARRAWPVAIGGVAAAIVLIAPVSGHIVDFTHSSFAHEPVTGHGNLPGPVPAAETLGVWLEGDFRFPADPYTLTVALDAVALLGLVLAVGWWLRRREPAIPAMLAAAGVVAWQSDTHRSIYNTAKALAIMAPIVALTLAPAGAAAWRRAQRAVGGAALAGRVAAGALGVVVAGAAAASSFLVLRDGHVGPPAPVQQVERLAARIGRGQTVLYLPIDDFAQWELRGTRMATGWGLYSPWRPPHRPEKPWLREAPYDADNFSAPTLDRFRYLITSSAAYQSEPPPNFHLVARTPEFLLWKREGRTPARVTVELPWAASARLDCSSRVGRQVLREGGTAAVVPAPVILTQEQWNAQPDAVGESVTQRVRLPKGRWNVSLQYVSRTGLDARIGSEHVRLPATRGRLGTFWPAGTVVQRHSGPVRVHLRVEPTSPFGSFLGSPALTRAFLSVNDAPLGRLVFTRAGVPERMVPVRAACGRYVDHLLPAGARAATR